jgi:hypothetical protein
MVQTEGKSNTVILISRNGMGSTTPELQHLLVSKYFQLLLDDGKRPAAICFYADGVRLVCEGSPIIDSLRAFETSGIRLIVCQTCLNTLGLMDRRQVGIVGGMGDIIEAQWRADKVITI